MLQHPDRLDELSKLADLLFSHILVNLSLVFQQYVHLVSSNDL